MDANKPVTKAHVVIVFIVAMALIALDVPFIATIGIMVLIVVAVYLIQQFINNKRKKEHE